jgi:alkylation response protein AidB-like acyl-CoA dehydrogenase
MAGDSEFCEVFLDGAPVANGDLLGPLDSGWTVATSVLADERASVGAAGIALRRRLESVHDPAVRADGLAIAGLLSRSGGDPMLGPLTKLANTEFDRRVTALALHDSGAEGLLVGEHTEPFLYSPGMRVAGGTSEIQRNLIAERLLGLPREPRPPAATS